jgi:hypothetical protein
MNQVMVEFWKKRSSQGHAGVQLIREMHSYESCLYARENLIEQRILACEHL